MLTILLKSNLDNKWQKITLLQQRIFSLYEKIDKGVIMFDLDAVEQQVVNIINASYSVENTVTENQKDDLYHLAATTPILVGYLVDSSSDKHLVVRLYSSNKTRLQKDYSFITEKERHLQTEKIIQTILNRKVR